MSIDPIRLALQAALGVVEGGPLAHDRFALHYAVLAPEGVHEVTSNPDPAAFTGSGHAVWRVDIQHRKGAVVDSRRGTADAIARVYADAARFEDLSGIAADFEAIASRFVTLRPHR